MQAGGERAGRPVHLYQRDVEVIRDQCPSVEVVAAEWKTGNVPVRSQFNDGRFLTLGVTPDYLRLRNLWLDKGRQVSAADVMEARRVAVLGFSVRQQLFGERSDVIGQTVQIRD